MPKLSPNEGAKKWSGRLGAATADVVAGIERVTESPMVKSAAAEDKWFAKIQAAHTSGKRKRALLGVSLDEWKKKAIEIGVPRIATGAAAAVPKMEKFYDKLFAFEQILQAKINKMPNVTLQDSAARANAWLFGMAEFDKTK